MLKLYPGGEVIPRNHKDIDPDHWLEEGELTELPEIPRSEAVERPTAAPRAKVPDVEMHALPESPEEVETRYTSSEQVHRRKTYSFYLEEWDEEQQQEDEWQVPDKWQRISQTVFPGGVFRDTSE